MPVEPESACKIDPLTVAVRLPVLEADKRVGDEGREYDCADMAPVRAGLVLSTNTPYAECAMIAD